MTSDAVASGVALGFWIACLIALTNGTQRR